MAYTASQKVKISIEAKKQDDKIFSRYKMFLIDTALYFGLGHFFMEKTDGNINILVAGEEKDVQRFYETLRENLGKYRIDNIKQPEAYNDHVPTIGMYLLLAHTSEAHNYAEAAAKAAKKAEETIEKINKAQERIQ